MTNLVEAPNLEGVKPWSKEELDVLNGFRAERNNKQQERQVEIQKALAETANYAYVVSPEDSRVAHHDPNRVIAEQGEDFGVDPTEVAKYLGEQDAQRAQVAAEAAQNPQNTN